jgi:hypothetical protein
MGEKKELLVKGFNHGHGLTLGNFITDRKFFGIYIFWNKFGED